MGSEHKKTFRDACTIFSPFYYLTTSLISWCAIYSILNNRMLIHLIRYCLKVNEYRKINGKALQLKRYLQSPIDYRKNDNVIWLVQIDLWNSRVLKSDFVALSLLYISLYECWREAAKSFVIYSFYCIINLIQSY